MDSVAAHRCGGGAVLVEPGMSYKRRDQHFIDCLQALTEKPKRRITDSQIVQMIWRNMQCIKPHCPLLIYGRQLADELNEFFWSEDE